jgi:peptidoglycan-associated lipoprotein
MVAAAALSVIHLGCTPGPRNVPCSNDGQCEKDSPAFRYCLESRCVECVGNTACGANGTCVDGKCAISCKDARGCPANRSCNDGVCALSE